MVTLLNALSQFRPVKIAVYGDFFLDSYTIGKVERISPEAPVPIVRVQEQRYLPGGAGNVVLNLLALEAKVVILGRIGGDRAGEVLSEHFAKLGAFQEGLVREEGYETPIKNRILVDQQQIVRVDHETIAPLASDCEEEILEKIPHLLADVSLVVVSDYGKGGVSPRCLSHLYDICTQKKIRTITDPKSADFTPYRGTWMIKPNEREAYAAAGCSQKEDLSVVQKRLANVLPETILIVTRGGKGISLFSPGEERIDFPAREREVVDVTGAGDTVLATLACSLANGIGMQESLRLANMAAELAITHVGCAHVGLAELSRRILQEDFPFPIMRKHQVVVEKALQGRSVVQIAIQEPFTLQGFSEIRKQVEAYKGNEIVISLPKKPFTREWQEILELLRPFGVFLVDEEHASRSLSSAHIFRSFSLVAGKVMEKAMV